jgi:VWFA-related protein
MKVTINQIDASYYPDVICYVVVTDEADRPLPGLTKDNFSVSEGGVIQNINSVSSIALGGGGQPTPISVVLTVDESGSMTEEDKMAAAVSAATKFIDLMHPDDKALIVGFSNGVSIYGDFSSSKPYLKSLVNNLAAVGQTALYDAVAISTDKVAKESGRKAVIALTDSIENKSKTKYEEMIEKVKKAGIPVYMIGLGNTINENVMRQIAWDTGGRYYHVPNSADLVNLYSSISQQLHQIYVVKYTTKAPLRSGIVHNVMVKVQSQGISGQDIKGYSGIVKMQ